MSQKPFFQFFRFSFIFLSKCLAKAWWRLKLWPECHTTLTPSLRGWALPVWLLVLPLWAVWKIHQAFPLESVRIREQALQWPHMQHKFYQSTLSSANVAFRRMQNHCRHQFASFLQVWCSTGVQMYAHRHQQSWIVKNRWTIPFSLQPFHTDGVRPDLYCVWVREQLALSGAIPPGRTATTVLSTSEHTALPFVRKPETQRGCRGWPG